MKSFTVTLAQEKAPKNTYRYEEQTEGEPPRIGTLYVQKWALGSAAPERIKVTVEAA